MKNNDSINYLTAHDYSEDDFIYEHEDYDELFYIKIGNFKLSFQRRYE